MTFVIISVFIVFTIFGVFYGIDNIENSSNDFSNTVNFNDYKGCIIIEKKATSVSYENIFFKKNNKVFYKTFLQGFWNEYQVGDTIK